MAAASCGFRLKPVTTATSSRSARCDTGGPYRFLREERVDQRLILVVDPAFPKQLIADRIDQQALHLRGLSVAPEDFAHQQRAALRPGHDIDNAEQLSIGAAGDISENGERRRLAPVYAGKGIAAEIVQREIVMVDCQYGLEVAGRPGCRITGEHAPDRFCGPAISGTKSGIGHRLLVLR